MVNTNEAVAASSKTAETGATNFNPLRFDESALADLLEKSYGAPEIEKQIKPEQPASDEDPEVEAPSQEENPDATDPSADQEAEEDLSQSDTTEESEQPEPEGIQKRINKLTAQKKEAQEALEAVRKEAEALKAKLTELETKQPEQQIQPVSADSPFSDVWDASKLVDERAKARNLKRWCEDHAEGAVVGDKEYSAEDVRAIKRRVEDAIEDHIPQREAFLREFQQIKPIAEQIYPFWKDSQSIQYAEAQQVLRMFPAMGNTPAYQVAIGDYLAGKRARLAAATAAAKPKPATKTAPKQPGPAKAMPAKADQKAKGVESASKQFFGRKDEASLAQLLEQTYGI